jgi:hypothetical protein
LAELVTDPLTGVGTGINNWMILHSYAQSYLNAGKGVQGGLLLIVFHSFKHIPTKINCYIVKSKKQNEQIGVTFVTNSETILLK